MESARPDDPISVELWAAPLPLPDPIVTPAGTFDTYHHLVVRALDRDGTAGWGLAAGVTSTELDATIDRAVALLDAAGPGTSGLIGVESIEARGTTTPADRWSRWAACALSTAGWDLRARAEEVACADLWGRRAGTESLECYASGLFLSTSAVALAEEARGQRDRGFRYVKMRTGLGLDTDLERLAIVRSVFPEPGAIGVDAVNGWTTSDAASFVHDAGPLLWVEDPVPPSDLGTLVELLRDETVTVAAGEDLTTLDALIELRSGAGVDAVLLDVQQVGGPARFLEAARQLTGLGARIGAHVFTPVSSHLLACVDDPLPVEVFDWSDALWSSPPGPDSAGRLTVHGPGLGLDLDLHSLRHHGRMIHRSIR